VTLTPEEFDELVRTDPALAEEFARAVLAQPRMGREYSPHEPYPKQRTFLELDCREALYGGAAGGGKSDALLLSALEYVHEPGYAAILFRRTYTELALPEAIMARSHEWLAGTDARWVDKDKQWLFPSGATLTFGYLDGPRDHLRYQGAAFQFVGWDELTQFPEKPYRYLFSRLRRLKGSTVPVRVRSATNPGGPGHEWVKARWGIPDDVDFSRVYNANGRVFVPARRTDNAALDHDAYEESLAELDTITREQLDKGRWVRDTSGLIYSDFDRSRAVVDFLPELPDGEDWRRILAMDFGSTKPTAFAAIYFSQHVPDAYVVEAEEWPDLSPSETAELAKEWAGKHGPFERMIGDVGGLGKGYETEWRKRFGMAMEAADKNDKLGYFKLLNGDFKHGRVKFVQSATTQLVENIETLAWKDETCREERPDQANHLPDALLYGWRYARHYRATPRKPVHVHGSPEWFREQDESARRQVFAKVRERLKKQARKVTTKARVRAIAKAGT
jgi:hypothetical protein